MPTRQSDDLHRQPPGQFILFTVTAAVSAALAAWSSAALALEVWVMFAGLIAWFTRPASWREGACAMICLWLGISLAAVSHVAMSALSPPLGALALPLVVFLVAILILGLRATRIVNNTLAWFLGMVTFHAAEMGLSPGTFAHLGGATAIGGFAGWACQAFHGYWAAARPLRGNGLAKPAAPRGNESNGADLG
ncbi:DUF1097 domain-containing protein [Acerihabitans arboris]|uniref:DUF1097 domain-containing protein n=1 Tax=Acerihabitans arboris TaxID=2691583 RepID=A0A845SN64_9GAMM|nr:DUF1097 domain-containing protein [Acerihabitans arboris]NDL63988.1 DUF1097 domain-containing protein [Acerihabitans arboris]